MKASHTRKLFYKKFLYKAAIRTNETGFIRYAHRTDIERLFSSERYEDWGGRIQEWRDPYAGYTWRNASYKDQRNKRIWQNRFTLYALYNWVNQNKAEFPGDLNIRNEGDKFAIFTSHKEVWDDFTKTFNQYVCELVWPKNDEHKQYLLNNPSNVICNDLPFGKYRYKVNLKNRIESSIQGFDEWVKNYGGEIHVGESLQRSINQGRVYLENCGFYINDSSLITLIQMYLGNNVRDVTEYITDDELDARSDK